MSRYVDQDPEVVATGTPAGYAGGVGCFGQPLAFRPYGRQEYLWSYANVVDGPAVVTDGDPVTVPYGTVGSG